MDINTMRQRSSPMISKLLLTLGVLIAAAAVVSVSGCAIGSSPSPDGNGEPTQTLPDLPSPAVQYSPLPDPSPTILDLAPEPWGENQKSYPFEYSCTSYSISLPLYQSSYEYFLSKDKNFYYRGSLPEDWQEQFYLNFLAPTADLETINDLIDKVRAVSGQFGDELVIALVSLVQNLPYDCDKLFSFDQLGGEGYQTNFPYETLYTQTGVCGDTSILLGKILQALGYGAAFLVYDDSNHMALGIECSLEVATYVQNQKGYCYIETTGPTRIGVKPTSLGGKDFNEDPLIIPISEGESFTRMVTLAGEMEQEAAAYGDRILRLATCQEINLFREITDRKAVITAHDGHLANLGIKKDQAYDGYSEALEVFQSMDCEGPLPQKQYDLCMAQLAVVEEEYAAYEAAVNEFNRVVDLRNGEVNQMNQAIEAFNILMDANYQSCAAVFSERIVTQEEGD